MIKIIVGLIGSGKTKKLIKLVNEATEHSNGNVICIEKGDKLRYDVSYHCRLINALEYKIDNEDEFYGFVSGIIASNSDITDIFVNSALKLCCDNQDDLVKFLNKISKTIEDSNINLTMTLSISESELKEELKKYLI